MIRESLVVRKATVDDSPGIAEVHVDSWRETYNGTVPDSYLKNLSFDKRSGFWHSILATPKDRHSVFVVEEKNRIIGFADGEFHEKSVSHLIENDHGSIACADLRAVFPLHKTFKSPS